MSFISGETSDPLYLTKIFTSSKRKLSPNKGPQDEINTSVGLGILRRRRIIWSLVLLDLLSRS